MLLENFSSPGFFSQPPHSWSRKSISDQQRNCLKISSVMSKFTGNEGEPRNSHIDHQGSHFSSGRDNQPEGEKRFRMGEAWKAICAFFSWPLPLRAHLSLRLFCEEGRFELVPHTVSRVQVATKSGCRISLRACL